MCLLDLLLGGRFHVLGMDFLDLHCIDVLDLYPVRLHQLVLPEALFLGCEKEGRRATRAEPPHNPGVAPCK